jgi:hypothetical protein
MWQYCSVKTTVEISDQLLAEARLYAASRRIPLRRLIEDGLRAVVQPGNMSKPFRLRDGSFGGRGLRENLSPGEIRSRGYEGLGEELG